MIIITHLKYQLEKYLSGYYSDDRYKGEYLILVKEIK